MPDLLTQTERTRLRRAPKRGSFDRETIHAILDAMPMCHVGCVVDGSPFVLPTFQWREGDHVYWHGSKAGRSMRAAEGADVCLTVSLLGFGALGCSQGGPRTGSADTSVAAISTGVVGELTGDPDDEVDAELQGLVGQAVALNEGDAPLDF